MSFKKLKPDCIICILYIFYVAFYQLVSGVNGQNVLRHVAQETEPEPFHVTIQDQASVMEITVTYKLATATNISFAVSITKAGNLVFVSLHV